MLVKSRGNSDGSCEENNERNPGRDTREARMKIMFEAFKEISIGGLTKEALLDRLGAAGIKFNAYAETLFTHPAFLPQQRIENVKLVKVKLSDFNLDNPCSFQELVSSASPSGLRLCPFYLAAHLRLEYLDQPEGPYLTIVSARPERNENYPSGFYLRNFDNSLWLRGYRADDFCEWPVDNEFVFLA